MLYRELGASGIEVSTLGLGTMMFGRWGNPDEDACRQMVDRALAGRRDRVVLATKVGNAMSDDPLERGLSARWVVQSCEA
ncbi:MAG: aldo/keto reductase, partial [Ilumatobacteraceae bacterium]